VIQPVRITAPGAASRELTLADLAVPLPLDFLAPGAGAWEVELGFGKGRYLLRRAAESPERRFLGVEVVSEYYQRVAQRARRRALRNLVVLRGEALFLLSAVLPRRFARAVHVYFPDPWPKSRHQKRRLFDPETVDLVLGLLAEDGALSFASDFLEYGELVESILRAVPGFTVERLRDGWPEGPRTNYEAKYVAEGRPIVRLVGSFRPSAGPTLHPEGRAGILVGERAAVTAASAPQALTES
jgi:tRNA (guanine-N7-)-methyltransferase